VWSREVARAVGERVIQARNAIGLSQRQLADALQLSHVRRSQAELSRLERGMAGEREYTNADLLVAIAQITRANPIWMMFGLDVVPTIVRSPAIPPRPGEPPPEPMFTTRIGAWEWDCERQLAHWSSNTTRLFAVEPYGRDLSLGEVLTHIHPDDRELLEYVTMTYLQHGKPFEFTARILLPDGEVAWFRSQGAPLPDDDGRVRRMVGFIQEIDSEMAAVASPRTVARVP
jgi:PAS domain-containing protein